MITWHNVDSIRSFLFDLDGTLIDSSEAILTSLQRSLYDVSGMHVSSEELDSLKGKSLLEIMNRLGVTNPEEVIQYYRSNYPFDCDVKVFDHIPRVLDFLKERQYLMAVVTTKGRYHCDKDMQETGLNQYFSAVITGDDVDRLKPDSEPVEAALNMLSHEPVNSIMVGDSEADILAAKAAGVSSALALWGKRRAPEGDQLFADVFLKDPLDIIAALDVQEPSGRGGPE